MADVPVVMLTRWAGATVRVAGFAAGAVVYLTKPFAISALDAAVDAVLTGGARSGS
jgi:DNA-binding response OmpR family regulator